MCQIIHLIVIEIKIDSFIYYLTCSEKALGFRPGMIGADIKVLILYLFMGKHIHSKHKVYNVCYHITWIPKYRKHVLVGDVKTYLQQILLYKAEQLSVSIEAIEIMPDHVHIFLRSNTYLSISIIVGQLKGYSSYMLRKKFRYLKTYKSLWTPSYFVETIGTISESTIKRYIELQQFRN